VGRLLVETKESHPSERLGYRYDYVPKSSYGGPTTGAGITTLAKIKQYGVVFCEALQNNVFIAKRLARALGGSFVINNENRSKNRERCF
jgi:hypothetical protein